MVKVLQIHPADTVAVALEPLARGTAIPQFGLTLDADIPQAHKFALRAIAPGERVIKYGAPIGVARAAIAPGDHVHTHNLKTGLGELLDYAYAGAPEAAAPAAGPRPKIRVFERLDGNIGVRNDLWIIPLVGCVNGLAENMARAVEASGMLPEGSRAMALTHPYGCSQLGDDMDNTRAILQDHAVHPNAGGVLILGLGCENTTLEYFQEGLTPSDPRRIRFLITQKVGDEMAEGLAACRELAAVMAGDRRVETGAERLRIGLKCGGSDGLSGITANPLLGAFSDWLCGIGGTTVLTEVPEMFGAEHLLMERAENRQVFDKTVALINDFKAYYIANKQPIYENPSPGNKEGGITTLEEKSLGCTQKAGHALVHDVLAYGERIREKGLNLLSSPGNDGVAITALSAAGCHMVLFTTGRGNPLGGAVPAVKVASNTTLATRKPHWIDFDAGPIADGLATVTGLRDTFIHAVLDAVEGKPTRNEINGIDDLVIFKNGVTL